MPRNRKIPDSPPTRRRARRATRSVAIVSALGVLVLIAVLVWALWLVMPTGQGLEGIDVSDEALTREAQISMIDQFAPIPTPAEATGITLRYRRFQDWLFDASFVLPPPALDTYVGQLGQRLPDDPGLAGWERYEGKRIGPHAGSVRVQRETGRVVVHHASS